MGFVDIGPIEIPPRPKKPAMVDRNNGNTYEITKSGGVPGLSLLSDTAGFQVFAAFDGPYVQQGRRTRRLFSSSGVIGSELVRFQADGHPVFITVAVSPLDVYRVVWDVPSQALSVIQEVL